MPATYDGRDIAGRLSARLDLPVITNVVGLTAEGDDLVSEHAIFGGSQVATAHFTSGHPWIFVVRAKSFSAEPGAATTPQVVAAPRARARGHGNSKGPRTPRRGAHGTEARRGRSGRVGRPRASGAPRTTP